MFGDGGAELKRVFGKGHVGYIGKFVLAVRDTRAANC